jgi:predicted permease
MRRRRVSETAARKEVAAELAFHFAQTVDELMRQGLTRAAAEAEARRRFGDDFSYRMELERMVRALETRRRWRGVAALLVQTARHAMRSAVRSPALSVSVILVFALGVGANAMMFGIVDRLLLSPPAHIVQPEAVRRLHVEQYEPSLGRRMLGGNVTLRDYEYLREHARMLDVAAFSDWRGLTVGKGEDSWRASALLVTASYWSVLGVKPALGRFFTAAEDRAGAEGTVVISQALWRARFAGASTVLGQTLDLGYDPYTIIGVTPAGFTGVDLGATSIWLPAYRAGAQLHGPDLLRDDGFYWLDLIARLRPGVSDEAAEADATRVHVLGRAESIAAGSYDAGARVMLSPLIAARGPRRPAEVNVALWLAGVSAVVLLIGCVNVANLLLARAIRQRRQTGIRLALGITRGRLALEVLGEGLLLALAGGLAAWLVAWRGGAALRTMLLPGVAWLPGPDIRMLACILVLTVLAGIAAAVLPLLEATRRDVARALRMAQGGITRSTARARTVLSVAQATLCVLLLVGAGLFIRSLQQVRALDLGFDQRGLLIATVTKAGNDPDDAALHRFFDAARAIVSTLPGVTATATASEVPFGNSSAVSHWIPGRDSLPRSPEGGPYVHAVSGDYLQTMSLQVRRGRGFNAGDQQGGERITIVNEAMAELYWPAGNALGGCLIIRVRGAPCARVIGIVENARRQSVLENPAPQYYVLLDQAVMEDPPSALFIRTAAEPRAVIPAIRRMLLDLEPRLRDASVRPLQQFIDAELRSWQLGATMFSVFGVLALLVASLGLYSLLAFDVAQRTREIGLRAALGAGAPRLVLMVVARALKLAVAGIALGLLLAGVLAPRLRSLLYAVSPHDPLTLGAVTGVLLVTALLAGGLPALRAVRVDPNRALRDD